MVTTYQPTMADLAQQVQIIPVGFDNGAGLGKICMGSGSGQMRLRIPSKVWEIKGDLHDALISKEGGQFLYVAGDRQDLIGREFLTGKAASDKAPTSCMKMSDDPSLKVEYILQALLGALSTLPYRTDWHLYLVPSTHNRKMFAENIIKNLSGHHVINLPGKNAAPTRVKIEVPLVAPEGAGSYAYAKGENLIDPAAHAIAFDFGTSTVIPVVFNTGGKVIHHQPLEIGGCVDLLEVIASDPELVSFLATGKAGSIELIRQGIESGLFRYDVRSRQGLRTLDYKPIYARHLKPWLSDRLRLGFKAIEEWRNEAQSFVAWGGGVEMPGVSQALKSINITAVSEGCWANAIGLQRMAEGLLIRRNK